MVSLLFDLLFWTRVESYCSTGVLDKALGENAVSGKMLALCGHFPVARDFWSP
jgi:hypothetical protein